MFTPHHIIFQRLIGVSFFHRMSRCMECNHAIDDTSHERCHTHADCAQGSLYYSLFCGVCQGLWSRSRDYENDMPDAILAYKELFRWVTGFIKNSKGREPGRDCFSDADERREFNVLKGILKPRKRAASKDSSFASSAPSKRVSIWLIYKVKFFLDIVLFARKKCNAYRSLMYCPFLS